jgi:hypothetical protein
MEECWEGKKNYLYNFFDFSFGVYFGWHWRVSYSFGGWEKLARS